MAHMRRAQGDVVLMDLAPVLPPTYVLMGRAANQYVLSDADPNLEQVLQQLINLLPVAASVPQEVDEKLQMKVAKLFQSERIVNSLLPSFAQRAATLRDRWVQPGGGTRAEGGGGVRADDSLAVFFELSEYVLLSDLEVLYGKRFTDQHSARILESFQQWILNIARGGNPTTFFSALGELLREAIEERRHAPEAYAEEESVLQVYLEEGALERHDVDGIVGLLSMTMMAAVFNTQVSLAWILVHLYSSPPLLAAAREELTACPDLAGSTYQQLARLKFVNSCIDESVRLHTMLPGNTVVRRAMADVTYADAALGGRVRIPKGSMIWLYPNAVHLDEEYFPQPKAFCPMRMLNGNIDRMSQQFELVTFGHGQKRCIGEKMARAMIVVFLGTVLTTVDAAPPQELPEDGFFDLIPASQLRLHALRRREAEAEGEGEGEGGRRDVAPASTAV